MALNDPPQSARSLLYDALAQNDVDMAHHRLLNLDTSNLPPIGIPPTIHPPANQWLHDWDAVTHEWGTSQPRFLDISGFLTRAQQDNISHVGTLTAGVWNATTIDRRFLPTLDRILPPLANVSLNSKRITDLAAPQNPGDAVNLAFMDFMLQGLQPKQAVRVATTGGDRELVGFPHIDGIDLVEGDRVLVKNQRSGREYQNGIYRVTPPPGQWARVDDADSEDELKRSYVTVLEGELNAGTSWVNSLVDIGSWPPRPGDDIEFILFSSAPQANIIAGAGLNKVGNTLNVVGTPARIAVFDGGDILAPHGVDIDAAYIGQPSINTVGTITTGTWSAGIISSSHGGTGADNQDHTISLGGVDLAIAKIGAAVPGDSLLFNVGAGITSLILPSSGTLATIDRPETFTNKAIVKRVQKIASNSKPSINTNQVDGFYITNLNENITSMSDNLTGVPSDCQELILWMKGGGVSLTDWLIAWGTKYGAASSLPLPTSIGAGESIVMRFVYNSETLKWIMLTLLRNLP